jgi:RNA polymerase sigma-70 factor (ECF subfamily)
MPLLRGHSAFVLCGAQIVTDGRVLESEATGTSSSLLQRAVLQDGTAWNRLVELYGPLIYHWCRKWGLQQGDADNVGQEVFLRVHQYLPKFERREDGGTFHGWLQKITSNCVKDHRRKLRTQAVTVGGTDAHKFLEQQPESPPEDDEASVREDNARLFRRAVELIRNEFSEQDWQAFSRYVLEGQPAEAVAAELGIATNVVYLAKSRILARLKQEFAGLIELP